MRGIGYSMYDGRSHSIIVLPARRVKSITPPYFIAPGDDPPCAPAFADYHYRTGFFLLFPECAHRIHIRGSQRGCKGGHHGHKYQHKRHD
jgi:hypothetical protein